MHKDMTTKYTVEAVSLGLDTEFIAEILEKWGLPILKLVIEGLRVGFTKEFLKEILQILGETWLRQIIGVRKAMLSKMVAGEDKACDEAPCAGTMVKKLAASEIIEGELIDGPVEANPLIALLVQLLAKILQDPELLKKLFEAIISMLADKVRQAR